MPKNQPTNSWASWLLAAAACLLIGFLVVRDSKPAVPRPPEAAPETQPATASAPAYEGNRLAHFTPLEKPANGYVSSRVCRECHPKQHESWHASYHRTMTQPANARTVIGRFAGQEAKFPEGGYYRLQKQGDLHWVEVRDEPQIPGSDQRTMRLPIVLTTGSHHMQVYWFATGRGRTLGILPMVYLRGEERWIPRNAAFIRPPEWGHEIEMTRWNRICANCHTTDPRARWDEAQGLFDTEVSEFGITCESCHGPGQDHIEFHSPGANKTGEDPIVNPLELDHQKSTQICGACHVAHRHLRPNGEFTNYLPGTDYSQARMPVRKSEAFVEAAVALSDDEARERKNLAEVYRTSFWPDGHIRIVGREYNGMLESACHTRGEMSCISCHRLHQGNSDPRPRKEWANDMLQPGRAGDGSCLQCHVADKFQTTKHTHHRMNSAGSSCQNCHMPHSNYGLLKAVRSHTIDSPRVTAGEVSDRPNACNLCHLDRTLEWSANYLSKWHGHEKPALTDEQRSVAAGPLWTLKGDAGIRALMAWHLSWPPATKAARSEWQAPYLAELLQDPYPAVRVIASRTKARLHPSITYDFLSSAADRQRAAKELVSAWQQSQGGKSHPPETLIDQGGAPRVERFDSLRRERDNRPVVLAE